MVAKQSLPRNLLATQSRAKAKAKAKAKAAAGRYSAERARRCAVRQKLGALRDRQIRASTRKRYRIHMKHFFQWLQKTGREVPNHADEFDGLCSAWAEHLWHEGDAKSILNNALCGLAFYCEGIRGKLNGSWKLWKEWGKSEAVRRAPPLPVAFTQAMAGEFARRGQCSVAIPIVVAHHCMLRTCEMLSLRTGDVAFCQGTIVLTLRETKMGQRIGVTQETVVDDPWVVPRLRHAVRSTASGQLVLGMTPARFRAMWKAAREALRLPQHYTPYSLRRGGAAAY